MPEDVEIEMLTYDLTSRRGTLCRRLYECIKSDVLSGKLSAGEKLPSKRSLARNLGVSAITVENAYDQLIAEGYAISEQRRGYYVSEYASKRKETGNHATSPTWVVAPKGEERLYFDFSSNQTENANFPFSVWARMLRETISRRGAALLKKSPCGGVVELRRAIAGHLSSFRAMTVEPDQIFVGAGTEYLYGTLIQLLGREKIYCIETPGYKKLLKIYEHSGAQCRSARMDEHGVVVDELRAARADVAHLCPNHHFPTGITTPLSRRFEILAWVNESAGRYVIEDDYDSEFRLNGRPLPTLQSVDAEKVVYMNTFSKSLASTIRISYMVLPPALANRFYETLSFYSCTVSTFEQYALAAFIGQGYFEKHINRMRLHYKRKRARILSEIRAILPDEACQIEENDSGLHFILRLTTRRSDGEIQARLMEHGVRIAAISDYETGDVSGDSRRFILGYSNLDEERLRPALELLRKAL